MSVQQSPEDKFGPTGHNWNGELNDEGYATCSRCGIAKHDYRNGTRFCGLTPEHALGSVVGEMMALRTGPNLHQEAVVEGICTALDALCEAFRVRDDRIAELEARETLWREYVELIGAENGQLIGLASVHGWHCLDANFQKGRELRSALGLEEK